ncbi:exfoliative toxin [Streptococcus pyogenes]|nr:exfoliative toxin [Streptococcus pyogenes]QNF80853.1 exfoliative toxin [Streptococcus pyogenes]TYL31541.1 exfoliative toxin [Streptococcus pyogenes]
MIDLKRNLFKIDVRSQKDEEKVFMRTACPPLICWFCCPLKYDIIDY